MKVIFNTAACLIFLIGQGCQRPQPATVMSAGVVAVTSHETPVEAPVATFEKAVVDFGQIPQGKPVSHKFQFTNAGGYTLKVQSVEPSCGCTAAEYTQVPLAPGESGFVLAEFNAAQAGSFHKTITFRSNASPAIQILTLKGEVLPGK